MCINSELLKWEVKSYFKWFNNCNVFIERLEINSKISGWQKVWDFIFL